MAVLVCLSVLTGCKQTSFMDRVNADFQQKKEMLPEGDLFRIFREPLSNEEKDALTFLYAYMPVGDITDYSGEFYLENVRASLAARQETEWGKIIPDDIFMHFVAPCARRHGRRARAGVVRILLLHLFPR